MYSSQYKSNATSPLVLGLVTLVLGVFMSIPVMMSASLSLAEKILTPLYIILISFAATMIARSIGFFKRNYSITPFLILLTQSIFGYNTGYWQGFLSSALLLAAFYYTIIVYKHRYHSWNAIDASICVCLASLFNGYILILLPVIVTGFAIYNRLDQHTIIACILGAVMIYGASWGVAFVSGCDCEYLLYLKSIMAWEGLAELRILDIISCSLIAVLVIISYIAFLRTQYKNNSIFVRKTTHFIYLVLLASVIIATVFGRTETITPFICAMLSILFTKHIENRNSKAEVIILYVITVIIVLLFIAKNFLF